MATISAPSIFYRTEGDTGPDITFTYKDSAGVAIDITGFTFSMHIAAPGGDVDVATTITDAPNGAGTFDGWTVSTFVAGEHQEATIKIVDASAVVITKRGLAFSVSRKIGT